MMLTDKKKEMILKTIEVRLEIIGEATRRARFTFIIVIIASSAMLITLWNTYYSYTSKYGLDDSFEFRARRFNTPKFIEKFDRKDPLSVYLYNKFDSETKNLINALNQVIKLESKDIEKENAINKKLQKPIINKINNELLTNSLLYTSQEIKGKYCESLNISKKEKDEIQKNEGASYVDLHMSELIKKLEVCPNILTNGGVLNEDPEKMLIEKLLSKDQVDLFPKTLNHINSFLLERSYQEIEWDTSFYGKDTPTALFGNNKRGAALEWIKNQNVSINILGINVHVNEFSFIGSLILLIISIWLFFSIRRENRAIVSLLRDVKKDLDRPSKNQQIGDDNWDIANLAFHGIAHKLLFAHTGGTDKPMSKKDIFDEEIFSTNRFGYFIDNFIRVLTKGIRNLVLLLLFLPVITIGITIYADIDSTYNSLSPYRINPEAKFIERNTNQMKMEIKQIVNENLWALSFGLVTFLICIACLGFQIRTNQALREFEKRLDPEKFAEKRKFINRIKILIFEVIFMTISLKNKLFSKN